MIRSALDGGGTPFPQETGRYMAVDFFSFLCYNENSEFEGGKT